MTEPIRDQEGKFSKTRYRFTEEDRRKSIESRERNKRARKDAEATFLQGTGFQSLEALFEAYPSARELFEQGEVAEDSLRRELRERVMALHGMPEPSPVSPPRKRHRIEHAVVVAPESIPVPGGHSEVACGHVAVVPPEPAQIVREHVEPWEETASLPPHERAYLYGQKRAGSSSWEFADLRPGDRYH